MEKLISLIFIYIFVENFVLQRFFGISPSSGIPENGTAGMSIRSLCYDPATWLPGGLYLRARSAGAIICKS